MKNKLPNVEKWILRIQNIQNKFIYIDILILMKINPIIRGLGFGVWC